MQKKEYPIDQSDATSRSASLPDINVNSSLVEPKLPEVTTTLPGVTTTLPGLTTTLPKVTTTLPGLTTTLPGVTTTLPGLTTTLPEVPTTLPGLTTTLPKVTTTLPGLTTTLPEVTTTLPGLTTTLPGLTTTLPEVKTTLPGLKTKLPGLTTTLPEVTTTPPGLTTTLPEVPTTLPEVPTTLPEVPTTLPEVPTTLPDVTTTPPGLTTTLPEVRSTLPEVTTTLPGLTTTLPGLTTTLPGLTTTLPEVKTTLPGLKTKLPGLTTKLLDVQTKFSTKREGLTAQQTSTTEQPTHDHLAPRLHQRVMANDKFSSWLCRQSKYSEPLGIGRPTLKTQRWRSLRNKVNTMVRQAENWHYRPCIKQLRGEAPRKWWECINRELGRSRDSGRVAVTDELSAESIKGTVPAVWKSANVVPVPKSAGASQVEDFRPVSLLAVLAKLLERCVLKRLLHALTTVIRDQYAYMKGSSTTIALVLNVGYADDVSLSRSLHVAVAISDRTVEEEATQLDMWASDNKMILNGNKSCPDGYVYHQSSRLCYKAFKYSTTYNGAVSRCSVDGGTLAMPRDTATNDFLIDLKNAVDKNRHFRFGLTDVHQEGAWMWDDNIPLGDFRPWGLGEPNNQGNEDCAEYFSESWFESRRKNTWNDASCIKASRKFICQIFPSAYARRGDTQYKIYTEAKTYYAAKQKCAADGGHLADIKTEALHNFLVEMINVDADAGRDYWIGLSDVKRGIDFKWSDGTPVADCGYSNWAPGEPAKVPTTGCVQLWARHDFKWDDDLCPGEQSVCGRNTGLDLCPAGYWKLRGACYKAVKDKKSFSDADTTCRNDGGTLFMPKDAETNEMLIPKVGRRGYWIGLHDRRKEGHFEWLDGSVLKVFNSWNRKNDEPDNRGNQDCHGRNLRNATRYQQPSGTKCYTTSGIPALVKRLNELETMNFYYSFKLP
ncbi:carbohydrate binding [Branchiostoma belcheri]|nr:carbohydrate binding [Branchiostoma belcheri]